VTVISTNRWECDRCSGQARTRGNPDLPPAGWHTIHMGADDGDGVLEHRELADLCEPCSYALEVWAANGGDVVAELDDSLFGAEVIDLTDLQARIAHPSNYVPEPTDAGRLTLELIDRGVPIDETLGLSVPELHRRCLIEDLVALGWGRDQLKAVSTDRLAQLLATADDTDSDDD